jgi:hypothetical protein
VLAGWLAPFLIYVGSAVGNVFNRRAYYKIKSCSDFPLNVLPKVYRFRPKGYLITNNQKEVFTMEKDHMILKDGEVDTSKVDETLDRMDSDRADEILSDFDEFKSYLSKRIQLGRTAGLSDEQLANTAQRIADYLAEKVEPRNREEQLLKELWKVGNEEQQHMLAHMLVKLAE